MNAAKEFPGHRSARTPLHELVAFSGQREDVLLMRSRGAKVAAIASVLILSGHGLAAADVVTQQEKDASGNYHLALSMEHVAIQSVPNMAAAPLVREGYITATTRFRVECRPNAANARCPDILLASLSVFAQIGCPMDLSSGIKDIGAAANFTAGLPANLAGLVPTNGDVTQIGIAPTVNNLGPLNPTVTVLPGTITDVSVGYKNIPPTKEELQQLESIAAIAEEVKTRAGNDPDVIESTRALGQRVEAVLNQQATDPAGLEVSVQNRHVVVDRFHEAACGGQVAIRMYATGTIKTSTSSDKLDVYGDIYTL